METAGKGSCTTQDYYGHELHGCFVCILRPHKRDTKACVVSLLYREVRG